MQPGQDAFPAPAHAAAGVQGQLAGNIVRFVRLLRHAGLPLGPDKAIDALRAVRAVGVTRRDDFYYALNAVLVSRHEQQVIFEQAFRLFWRNPEHAASDLQNLMQQLGSALNKPDSSRMSLSPRITQALWPGRAQPPGPQPALPPELELDASMTLSAREQLQSRDFAAMTTAEFDEARRMLADMRLSLPAIPTRRHRAAPRGRVDMRNTMRQMMRAGGQWGSFSRSAAQPRQPALVILVDISGSMDNYSRMLLHFIHAVTNDRSRVHSFLFGTRLTNITRALRDRDVDVALARVSGQVQDWAGGTRIAGCLHEFNLRWGRRLLGQGAVVLLITDGLDSGDPVLLSKEMALLSRSCRQLLWLNPLLRYAGFEAKPAGIRAMLPHVDRFLPVHDLRSLAQLARVLQQA